MGDSELFPLVNSSTENSTSESTNQSYQSGDVSSKDANQTTDAVARDVRLPNQMEDSTVVATNKMPDPNLTTLPTQSTITTTTTSTTTTTTTTTTEEPTIPLIFHASYQNLQRSTTSILLDALGGVRVPVRSLQYNELLGIIFQKVDLFNLVKRILSQEDIRNSVPRPESVDSRCYNDTVDFVDGLIGRRQDASSKEYATADWAFRMVDAFGKPEAGFLRGTPHWVGDYDECFETHAIIPAGAFLGTRQTAREVTVEFDARYCRVEFVVPGGFIGYDQKPGFWKTLALRPFLIHLGVCLPNSCNHHDVKNLLIQGNLVPAPLQVSDVICFDKEDDLDSDGWAIFAICLLSVVGGIAVICTVVESAIFYGYLSVSGKEDLPTVDGVLKGTGSTTSYCPKQMYGGVSDVNTPEIKSIDRTDDSIQNGTGEPKPANLRTPLKNDHKKKDLTKEDKRALTDSDTTMHAERNVGKTSIGVQFVESFSLRSNWSKLLDTSATSNKDTIMCLQGIRTIAIMWIVLGHTYLYDSVTDPKNIMISVVDEVPKMLDRLSFTFVVGTMMAVDFFFVMSGMLVMKLTLRKLRKGKAQGPGFWITFYGHRLWRLTPVYMMVLMTGTTLYDHLVDGPLKAEPNSMFEHCPSHWWTNLLYINNLFKPLEMCMIWTWYLAVDVQLFVISPIFILLVHRKYRFGILFLLATIVLGTIGTFVASYENPGQILTATYIDDSYVKNVYLAPWPRLAVFAVGMLLGVLLEDADSIPAISKVKALALWLFLGGMTVFLLMIPHDQWKDEGDLWPKGTQAVYEASCRLFWSLFAAWVIYACQSNLGGIVSSFLEWPGFGVLARLTYTVYLVHPMVLTFFLYERNATIYPHDTMVIYMFCGNLIMAYLVAILYHLLFEAPMLGLEKIFLRRK